MQNYLVHAYVISMEFSAVNHRRPSRETPLGAKKDGCFHRLKHKLCKERIIIVLFAIGVIFSSSVMAAFTSVIVSSFNCYFWTSITMEFIYLSQVFPLNVKGQSHT